MGVLTDKVVLVLGGGRGIGRATALFAANQGARLVVADNGCAPDGSGSDAQVAESAAEEVRACGAEALAIDVDLAAPDAPARVLADVRSRFGRVDAAFYCAGVARERTFLRSSDEDFERVFDVQVRGAIRFARELGRVLVEQRHGGSLLLTAAPEGFFGAAHKATSAAAAGAIVGFARTAALELRRHGIRLNTLVPTARTRLTEQLPLFASIRPDSMTAEHVAHAAAFLLSDAARDVHGEVLGVAGGRLYGLRATETPGAFFEGAPASIELLAARFREATREG